MVETLVWVLLTLVAYTYIFYPILLLFLSALVQCKRDVIYAVGKGGTRIDLIEEAQYLDVAVIISAFNEEKCIEARVENLQNLDYPKNKIKYYIGSDGSSDLTAKILQKIDDPNLIFINFEENRGKASVLNDLVESANADILVFSDANTQFEPDAIKKLQRHFCGDGSADAVVGELSLVDATSGKNLDNAYWQYERVLKFNESRINALLGANGAIYALRNRIYSPIPNDTLVDDFTIVFRLSLEGGSVLYDPEARAVEEVAPSVEDEYKRRVRIGSGNYQVFHRFLRAMNPRHGALWFSYVSHKVLRWYTPFFLLMAMAGSLFLAFDSMFYAAFFTLQLTVYIMCFIFKKEDVKYFPVRILVFWVNMNIALGHGALRYYSGGLKGTWDSTDR